MEKNQIIMIQRRLLSIINIGEKKTVLKTVVHPVRAHRFHRHLAKKSVILMDITRHIRKVRQKH